jgi:hypothetical protein
MRRVDLAEVHLFQTTGFDPLRNPDPAIEKRHKRLMSYRRIWQRTWEKALAEIQRHRDMDAELAAQEAEATPEQTPKTICGNEAKPRRTRIPSTTCPRSWPPGTTKSAPTTPHSNRSSTRISSSEPGGPQKELSARHNPPGSGTSSNRNLTRNRSSQLRQRPKCAGRRARPADSGSNRGGSPRCGASTRPSFRPDSRKPPGAGERLPSPAGRPTVGGRGAGETIRTAAR